MSIQVTLELPDEALRTAQIGPERLSREVLEAVILRWFEEGRLSQGQVATALGLPRGDFFGLLHDRHISPVQMTVAELEEDFRSV